jgi:wyosine [tRNA(Phe)-imidazoG37] synthetase (radical SAM superfamily)
MASKPRPNLLFAAQDGTIFDHPDLRMLVRRGRELALPRPDEYIPLPEESELLTLPGRGAMGLDPESGELVVLEENAVAAFVAPGHTLSGTPAYESREGAPLLPLLSYAPVGYAEGRIWAAVKRVDDDRRQVFKNVDPERIRKGAERWLAKYPDNRLVAHLSRCALTYCCPAARNLALGRFEAPLPTARACNAGCLGCISLQPDESAIQAPQNRIDFTPTAKEIVEVMAEHASREKRPIFSFGQGCEGEPLTEWKLLAEAASRYRSAGGAGTVNVNSNASMPQAMEPLARAGFDSIRVSLNSARPEFYEAYYRPRGYSFADVAACIAEAKRHGLFVSLNLLYFPGVTDGEKEFEAIAELVEETSPDFIQLRNMNLDPEMYLNLASAYPSGPSMGLNNFRKRLKKSFSFLKFGYFNPYLS